MPTKLYKTFSADTQEELDNLISKNGHGGSTTQPVTDGHQLSLEQRVINLEGQTKVLYDRLEDIKQAPIKDKTVTIPQSLLDSISNMKSEITKNIDSLTQNHEDFNEFLKTHPTDTEIAIKFKIITDAMDVLRTTQANAQKLVNQNAEKLSNIKSFCIPSHYRKLYRVMAGDGPDLNVTDEILTFTKIGEMITLEIPISDEEQDWEIVINNTDPYSFYIPSYTTYGSDPLRARLTAGGLDFQVHGGDSKFQIWCTADPRHIGIFELRQKWTKGSV